MTIKQPILEGEGQAADDGASQASSVATNTTGNKSKRSRSPLKNMADLRLAEKPIKVIYLRQKEQLPADMTSLFIKARDIRIGRGIIPEPVEEQVQDVMTLRDDTLDLGSLFD